MHEITWRFAIPIACLSNLSSCPLAGRVAGRSHMHDLPAGMMNDEEDVDGPEQDRLDAEEITGPDITRMGGQKPASGRRWRSPADATHVPGDGPRRHLEAQTG